MAGAPVPVPAPKSLNTYMVLMGYEPGKGGKSCYSMFSRATVFLLPPGPSEAGGAAWEGWDVPLHAEVFTDFSSLDCSLSSPPYVH